MEFLDLAVVGGQLVTTDGIRAADVGIIGERVAAVAAPGHLPPAKRTIDAEGDYVLPGLVDPHTHPGNFRPLSDDVASETRSAAVGGVTTMFGTVKATRMGFETNEIARPEDVVSYLKVWEAGHKIASTLAHVDVAYSFIISTREQAQEIPEYVRECGVRSFKFFLTYPPTSEWGARVGMPLFPDEGTVFLGFRRCAETGSLAMVHAEHGQAIHAVGHELAAGKDGLEAWEAHFPGALEASEVRKAAYFARTVGVTYYGTHISSVEGLRAVEQQRREGSSIVAETCPQYLALDLEQHAERGALAKFNPPVRHRRDADALWDALSRGAIQCLGSDHVPNQRARKLGLSVQHGQADGPSYSSSGDGSIEHAIPASPGVATLLPVLWTFGVAAGHITAERLVELCCEAPARTFGVYPRKGTLMPGADADLVIVNARETRAVDPARLHSWADFSAYEGMPLTGWPRLTLLRGEVVAEQGEPVGAARGRYLAR